MLLHLHRASRSPCLDIFQSRHLQRSPDLQRSMPPYFDVATPAARLHTSLPPPRFSRSAAPEPQSSIPLCVQIYTPVTRLQQSLRPYLQASTHAARLKSSMHPYLHVATPTARLQSCRALEPHTYTSIHLHRGPRSCMPPRPHTRSAPPDLQTSSSTRPQHASGVLPLYLRVATPASSFHTSIFLCLRFPHTRSAPPDLRPPYLDITAPAVRLQNSIPLRLHTYCSSSKLHSSMPPCLHLRPVSRAPYFLPRVCTPAARLQRSLLLVGTPAARHQISTDPCLYVYMPPARLRISRAPYLYSSTAACQQSASRPLDLHASTSACHQPPFRAPRIHTAVLLRLYACSVPLDLYSSIHPYLHA